MPHHFIDKIDALLMSLLSLAFLTLVPIFIVWIAAKLAHVIAGRLLRNDIAHRTYVVLASAAILGPLLLAWVVPLVLSLGRCGGWMDSPSYSCSLAQSFDELFLGFYGFMWAWTVVMFAPLWAGPCLYVFTRRWKKHRQDMKVA
jgi:hypothetical protein